MPRGRRKSGPQGLGSGSHDNGYRRKDPSFCANCGDQVTSAGRASADGKRFCRKPQCQAIKARRHRARAAALRPDKEAPSTCSGCGAKLTERKWRAGDDLGRWCRKASCRAKRDRVRTEAGLDQVPALLKQAELDENGRELLGDAIMADNEHVTTHARVVCPDCGLTSALKEWPHQTASNSYCWGTLNGAKKRPFDLSYLSYAWPFKREYLDPEALATLFSNHAPAVATEPKDTRTPGQINRDRMAARRAAYHERHPDMA